MKREMNQCVFPPGLKLKISSFHRRKILLLPSGPNFRFTKHVSLYFQDCVKRLLGHIVPFHEKKKKSSGADFLWVLTAIPLVSWLSESIPSDVFLARNGKKHVSFRKLKCLNKTVVVMKRKWTRISSRQTQPWSGIWVFLMKQAACNF